MLENLENATGYVTKELKMLYDNILIIVDMQNDFIDGSLANPAAQNIVDLMCETIKHNKDRWDAIIFTRDTHGEDYFSTQEGKKLPIEHCIKDSVGWCVNDKLFKTVRETKLPYHFVDKYNFGYDNWRSINHVFNTAKVTMVGTCTDICVINNALLLKSELPEVEVEVIGNLCAGLTKEKHEAALEVMRSCQITVSQVNQVLDIYILYE